MVELASQLQQVQEERDALKKDMDAVLAHRTGLEEMKRVVMRAVGGSVSGLVQPQAGGGAVSSNMSTGAVASPVLYFQGAGLHGSTTILRE
jgi:hypothetical protein